MKKVIDWVKSHPKTSVFIFLLSIVLGASSSPTPVPQSSPVATSSVKETTDTRHKVGDTIVLSEEIVLGREKGDIDKFFSSVRAKDNYGVNSMLLDGSAIDLDAGTKVLVIDSSFTMDQVRVLSGPHAGESGWSAFELIH